MASYNKVILIGRLTKDPELRYTASGIATSKFTLAVNRTFKNENGEEEADFINIVVWRNLAEITSKFLQKGSLAMVEGRLQIRSYEDSNNQKKWMTEVIANTVQFLDKKGTNNSNMNVDNSGFNDQDDNDDIPF
jgi:single-strand DNA-binding protein